ncbi:DoxX family protein [Streptomyces polyrhachis]|uniref:DoxX family protein n=1 Tax=Streptomyces polyrhachis TaxID=1282885 RepID=A0ABW2GD25_9ACTN
MDTRSPRPPRGGRPQGFEDAADALSAVRVPSDPARISVNSVSFRVRLGPASGAFAARPAARPVAASLSVGAEGVPVPRVRRAPVVWSGRSTPGDPAAGQLLQAVRQSGVTLVEEPAYGTAYEGPDGTGFASPYDASPYEGGGPDATETQSLPRFDPDATAPLPVVVAPRAAVDETQLLPPLREFDESRYPGDGHVEPRPLDVPADPDGPAPGPRSRRRRVVGADSARHAYYPGRRLNLGVVLLPLRIFLGFIAVYSGMGKLCDPLYFETGERGRLVGWLHGLEPGGPLSFAEPLHGLALAHPLGVGLTVAFGQTIVGVLTICGLWQRLAAALGALLAAGLVIAMTWRAHAGYEVSALLYLAAWAPLIAAGAPVYSVDARLAGRAWRRLGPHAALWELRRFVLRRGVVYATVVIGLTLLLGSLLGAAVRSVTTVHVPGPGEPPVNQLPGEPLPTPPGSEGRGGPAGAGSPSPSEAEAEDSAAPSESAAADGPTAGTTSEAPPTTGTEGAAPPVQPTAPQQQSPTQEQTPAPPPPPPGDGDGTTGGGSGDGDGSDDPEERPGLIGGLLG